MVPGETNFAPLLSRLETHWAKSASLPITSRQGAFDLNFRFDGLPVRERSQRCRAPGGPDPPRSIGSFAVENSGVAQDILDEPVEPDGGAHDLVKIIESLFIQLAAVFIHQKLGETLHGPQRRAHVMRYAVGESFEFADRFAKFTGAFRDHLLQFEGMPAEFILGGQQRLLGPAAFGDILRHCQKGFFVPGRAG